MSLRSYDGLVSGIEGWLHRVGEPQLVTRIPEFIELVEDKLNHELRILAMEGRANLTLSDQTIDLPADYRGVRRMTLPGNPNYKIEFTSPASFWGRWFASEFGQPKFYTIEGAQEGSESDYTISFGPWRTETQEGDPQTVILLYWKMLPALSESQPTNWYTRNAVGLYLYGALIEASQYFNKPVADTAKWAQNYDSLIQTVKSSDRDMRMPMDGAAQQPWGVAIA